MAHRRGHPLALDGCLNSGNHRIRLDERRGEAGGEQKDEGEDEHAEGHCGFGVGVREAEVGGVGESVSQCECARGRAQFSSIYA